MQDFEFPVPESAQLENIETTIESICAEEGLQLGMKASLAAFPGSTHWHFKRPAERGTLEITFHPPARRIWASIQAGRRADWIEPCIARISDRLRIALAR